MLRHCFGKSARLLNANDYKAVFDKADYKVSNREFLFLARRNGFDRSRLGLIIAKKHVRLAVDRNRLKRHIRETFRLQESTRGVDVVVLARKGADHHPNPELKRQLNRLWRKLGQRIQATDP